MTDEQVIRALAQEHLLFFTWLAHGVVEPDGTFVPYAHVRAICDVLERAERGEIRRLIITVPPRHGKSTCVAVAFAAWLIGRNPSTKILVASYGAELANKHAADFRKVVTSAWFGWLFPNAQLDRNGPVYEQKTKRGGFRRAVSPGGSGTGFGAEVVVIDDLMKAADATSPVERQKMRDYYTGTLLSRFNDKRKGLVIVIQQRLHEDDLVGQLLETGGFYHLNLPSIAVEEQVVPLGFGEVLHRRKDDVLWPEVEPREVLEQQRLEMGNAAFSAQYQQDPTPPGGNRIRWEWFGTYDEEVRRNDFTYRVQSWDTAMSAQPTSDFSVCTTWGYRDGKWHLLDLERRRYDFPELKRRAWGLMERWRPDYVIVEQGSAGTSLVQQLRKDHQAYNVILCTPTEDKATRVEAQSARLETGNYVLPVQAPWLEDLRKELNGFPNARHDDQVDSLIQFVEWSNGRRAEGLLVPKDPVTGRPLFTNRPQTTARPKYTR